MKQSDV